MEEQKPNIIESDIFFIVGSAFIFLSSLRLIFIGAYNLGLLLLIAVIFLNIFKIIEIKNG